MLPEPDGGVFNCALKNIRLSWSRGAGAPDLFAPALMSRTEASRSPILSLRLPGQKRIVAF